MTSEKNKHIEIDEKDFNRDIDNEIRKYKQIKKLKIITYLLIILASLIIVTILYPYICKILDKWFFIKYNS